ncbi:MAG TPA: DUF3786 domain-containing protein [Patescibacteria group bacterium]|nr:DUF3786 domain-containing protein [Patescibacteria group bacterium]
METGKGATQQNLQDGYQLAYTKACGELDGRKPEEVAAASGADYDSAQGEFNLKYLNETYTVAYPGGAVAFANRDDEVSVATKIVIMHYLLTAGGLPVAGEQISFKELPGGTIYLEPFTNRVMRGFVGMFGKKAGMLLPAAEKLGGREVKLGSAAAVVLDMFPRLPLTYVIWEGDDEMPANGTVLFDKTAQYYLPTEDLVVVAAAGASLLGKTARAMV